MLLRFVFENYIFVENQSILLNSTSIMFLQFEYNKCINLSSVFRKMNKNYMGTIKKKKL